ncbi:MAG: flagellar biosynthetic protein FliO [Steroidobacteraceae bacterium]
MNRITRAPNWRRAGMALLLLAATLPAAAAAAAAAGTPFAAPQAPALPGPTGGLLRVVVSLALVLAAVAAAGWVLRRMRGLGTGDGRAIELVAQAALGSRERVVLVRVGGHELLLGVAAGSVRTLLVLGDSVAVAADAAARTAASASASAPATAAAAAPPSFAAALRAVVARSFGR